MFYVIFNPRGMNATDSFYLIFPVFAGIPLNLFKFGAGRAHMPVGTQDKRRFSRLPCRLELRYQPRGAGNFNNALSDDISVQGISFVNDKFLAPNTCLGLEINIFSNLITPVGRVAWVNRLPYSNRYRVGVEFIEMDQPNKNYLGDYVAMQMDKLA